jgi:hypothetical protein
LRRPMTKSLGRFGVRGWDLRKIESFAEETLSCDGEAAERWVDVRKYATLLKDDQKKGQ